MKFKRDFVLNRVNNLLQEGRGEAVKLIVDKVLSPQITDMISVAGEDHPNSDENLFIVDVEDINICKEILDVSIEETIELDQFSRDRFSQKQAEMSSDDFNVWNGKSFELWAAYSKKEWLKHHRDVLCNNCGNSCLIFDMLMPEPDAYGLVGCQVSGGFFSHHLCDMTSYNFSLCEKCLKEIFDTFVIPVKETKY